MNGRDYLAPVTEVAGITTRDTILMTVSVDTDRSGHSGYFRSKKTYCPYDDFVYEDTEDDWIDIQP